MNRRCGRGRILGRSHASTNDPVSSPFVCINTPIPAPTNSKAEIGTEGDRQMQTAAQLQILLEEYQRLGHEPSSFGAFDRPSNLSPNISDRTEDCLDELPEERTTESFLALPRLSTMVHIQQGRHTGEYLALTCCRTSLFLVGGLSANLSANLSAIVVTTYRALSTVQTSSSPTKRTPDNGHPQIEPR